MKALSDQNLRSRLLGCAVGSVVGDALGMPLEFGEPRPLNRLITEMLPGRLPAGRFTDDTEMSIAVAESLLATHPLDGDDLAKRFVQWHKSMPPDEGLQTSRVLSWLEKGESWQTVSERIEREMPDSAGNGSIMRCWPIAVLWWNNRSQRIADSTLQSRITHPHPDCIAACKWLNLMIVDLAKGASPLQAFDASLQSIVIPEDFRKMLNAAPQRSRQELKNTGWVRHTAESAIWALLNTSSFEDAVVQAVNLGGDADTVGAVVGALAGAAYGIETIPQRWRSSLQGEWPLNSGNVWREADFVGLADRLMTLAQSA